MKKLMSTTAALIALTVYRLSWGEPVVARC
jgi:hypothetical protein